MTYSGITKKYKTIISSKQISSTRIPQKTQMNKGPHVPASAPHVTEPRPERLEALSDA